MQVPVPWLGQRLIKFLVGCLVDVDQHDLRRWSVATHKKGNIISSHPQAAAKVQLPKQNSPSQTNDADQQRGENSFAQPRLQDRLHPIHGFLTSNQANRVRLTERSCVSVTLR